MKSRRHSKHRSRKGKEPTGSNIIDLSESPVKNMPSSNASNDTNMANEATVTGANTIPLGTGSEGSSGRAGAPPKTPNPFSPSPVSMGPRPKGVWQPYLPLFSSEDFEEPRTGEKPGANNNLGPGGPLIVVERQGHGKILVFQDQKLESSEGVRGLLVPVSTNTPTRRPLAGGISGQPELDTLVDSWNKVFARRFCQMHKGYFENGDWATTEKRNQSDGVSNSTSDNQRKRPRLDSGISSDVSPRIGSREEASRPQQRQLSPLRRPPASRTPGRPSSSPTQERQSRPAGSFPRGHDSQYPDKWVGDGEPHRPCQPRGFREDTVEFDNMSTRRQNQLIRTQNRTLLEKLEELGPRSERGPRNNHDSYHRP
ncbi:hypothetical protein BFJ63_vAg12892 [Fusarium oxysporum f. sp. narcissi]|uniref:Uncharacterized protein n=1 Tax=Fusarium oxysporum f. sp. narcissi TaxID=451672 RepID=A0A4V1RZ83_FUSOX|nr:hypothetical protein BFJ63_vAg12892 [Fusarium oxysporum f. sp. narcissi]